MYPNPDVCPGTEASAPGPKRVQGQRASRYGDQAEAGPSDYRNTSPAPRPPAAPAPAAPAVMQREPTPSTSATGLQQLYTELQEYLLLEDKYQPRLCLSEENEQGEVSTGARDGAAHVLRCLKVWFDLPTSVLIHAINLFDRFLTKMKVRSCHVPCITVASMNLALEHHAAASGTTPTVSVDELVSISQSACTGRDVVRMSHIMKTKLSLAGGRWERAPAVRCVELFSSLAGCACPDDLAPLLHTATERSMKLLEIVACDYKCANFRISEMALVVLFHSLETELVEWARRVSTGAGLSPAPAPAPDHAYRLFDVAAQLQDLCHMSCNGVSSCLTAVRGVLARYHTARGSDQRQRLVWRLSERTLKVLRPTDRLTSLLPTIEEQQNHLAEHSTPTRNRSGSESSENEETSDWPRSPVLPVYCDN